MQNSKRIQRVIKKLDSIQELINYYTNGSGEYDGDFVDIRSTLNELSIDKKKDHARFAKKLKYLWDSSNKEDS